MSSNVIEIVTFKLKPGVTQEQYLEKYQPVLEKVLKENSDFVSLQNLYDSESGMMANYVVWKSLEEAKKANAEFMKNPIVAEWFGLIEQSSIQMNHFKEI